MVLVFIGFENIVHIKVTVKILKHDDKVKQDLARLAKSLLRGAMESTLTCSVVIYHCTKNLHNKGKSMNSK